MKAVRFTLLPLYRLGKVFHYPSGVRVGGTQSQYERNGEEKNLCPPRESNSGRQDRVLRVRSRSMVILT
jgi:hypothetical protein